MRHLTCILLIGCLCGTKSLLAQDYHDYHVQPVDFTRIEIELRQKVVAFGDPNVVRRHRVDINELKSTVRMLRIRSEQLVTSNRVDCRVLANEVRQTQLAQDSVMQSAREYRQHAAEESYTSVQSDYQQAARMFDSFRADLAYQVQEQKRMLAILEEHLAYIESVNLFLERLEAGLAPIPSGHTDARYVVFLEEVTEFIQEYDKLRSRLIEEHQKLESHAEQVRQKRADQR